MEPELTTIINAPPHVVRRAEIGARAMLDEVNGTNAVVVASIDGFDLASAVHGDLDPSRVAAMASSIAAIGGVVSMEASLGRSKSVTIDTDSGFAVVYTVDRTDLQLVIVAIGGVGAVLGQVVYRAAQFARELAAA